MDLARVGSTTWPRPRRLRSRNQSPRSSTAMPSATLNQNMTPPLIGWGASVPRAARVRRARGSGESGALPVLRERLVPVAVPVVERHRPVGAGVLDDVAAAA